MNRLTIIGNLTRAPEARATADGNTVTAFTVAVNRGSKNGHPVADFIRVSAWNKLGENCENTWAKGKRFASPAQCAHQPIWVRTARPGRAWK